ncbi:MAG: hypothetical protein ACREBD_34505 [Blastocatellia bacterium]
MNSARAVFVLEARRNPKGLGSLEEKRLLAGEYPFRELEKLSQEERDALLDSSVRRWWCCSVTRKRSRAPINGAVRRVTRWATANLI